MIRGKAPNVSGLEDRAKGEGAELKGKAKEAAGRATGDPALRGRGEAEQAKGKSQGLLGRDTIADLPELATAMARRGLHWRRRRRRYGPQLAALPAREPQMGLATATTIAVCTPTLRDPKNDKKTTSRTAPPTISTWKAFGIDCARG